MNKTEITGIEIGCTVKLTNLHGSPFPKLMSRSIQKVVDLRWNDSTQEARIERQHRGHTVKCWIPVSLIAQVLSPEEAYPSSACPIYAPHKPGAGEEAYSRQYCLICSEKSCCPYYLGRSHGRG